MRKLLLIATMALPIASQAQYIENGTVYVTVSGSPNASDTVSTAASTSAGQLLIGTGSAPTWVSDLPFSFVVNLNDSAPVPGLQGMSGQVLAEFAATDSTVGRIIFDSFGPGQTGLDFRSALGSNAAPSALQAGSLMGAIQWFGYEANAWQRARAGASARAGVGVSAAENWSTTANGTFMSFNTTQPTTTTINEKMRLYGDGGLAIGNSIVTIDPGAANLLVAGAVGIGITDPQTQFASYQLAVNGTIEAKEVVAIQNGWSDYVLAPGILVGTAVRGGGPNKEGRPPVGNSIGEGDRGAWRQRG